MIRADDYGSGDASRGLPDPWTRSSSSRPSRKRSTPSKPRTSSIASGSRTRACGKVRHRPSAIGSGGSPRPPSCAATLDDIKTFADEIRRLQFTHVVVLGMGGASLCGEVFNLAFGSKMGFPDLVLLDSTDPATVKQTFERLNLSRTLFIVASKSGDTLETLAFYEYFRGQVEASRSRARACSSWPSPTPARPLDKIASETGFRRTFLNPASIGGRYSALSFFGLVPAALMGIDIKVLLERAHAMVEACGNAVSARDNAAVRLGRRPRRAGQGRP